MSIGRSNSAEDLRIGVEKQELTDVSVEGHVWLELINCLPSCRFLHRQSHGESRVMVKTADEG